MIRLTLGWSVMANIQCHYYYHSQMSHCRNVTVVMKHLLGYILSSFTQKCNSASLIGRTEFTERDKSSFVMEESRVRLGPAVSHRPCRYKWCFPTRGLATSGASMGGRRCWSAVLCRVADSAPLL